MPRARQTKRFYYVITEQLSCVDDKINLVAIVALQQNDSNSGNYTQTNNLISSSLSAFIGTHAMFCKSGNLPSFAKTKIQLRLHNRKFHA